eukprot:1040980-Pleurochrysis_carterae.AAC.1
MAALLSRCSAVASRVSSPSSSRSARRYVASFAASEAATISASHEESATVACFLLLHVMAACPYMNTCPDVECRVAQSESENPASGRLSARA